MTDNITIRQIALKANVKQKVVQKVLTAVRDGVARKLRSGASANIRAFANFRMKYIPAKPARKKMCWGKDCWRREFFADCAIEMKLTRCFVINWKLK